MRKAQKFNPLIKDYYLCCWELMIHQQEEVKQRTVELNEYQQEILTKLYKKISKKTTRDGWLKTGDEICKLLKMEKNPLRSQYVIQSLKPMFGIAHVGNTIFLYEHKHTYALANFNRFWKNLSISQTKIIDWTKKAQKILDNA